MNRTATGRELTFAGQTVLITGASSGIGAEFARALSSRGADCILVARREEKLVDLQSELARNSSAQNQVVTADLSSPGGTAKIVKLIRDRKVDLLVNNAGVGSFGYLETLDSQSELAQVALNVTATTALAQAIIPQLKERGSGGIINVSSIAAFVPLPLMATYAATKAYNFQHGLALSSELRSAGVTLTVLCPGPVATEFGGVARVPGTMTGGHRAEPEFIVAAAISAYLAKKTICVPGWRAKAVVLLSKVLPKAILVRIVHHYLSDVLEKSQRQAE